LSKLPTGIKLRQLQYFLAAAEQLHFSRAAEDVAATQPTLSHQIAQMEQNLGAVLFNRHGKKVSLTEAGRILKEHATRAIRELEAGCVALGELSGLERGILRIGVIQSFCRTLLPPILGDFIGRYPAIQVLVEEMTAPTIAQRLSEGQLDLGIAFAPASLPDIEVEPVLEERLLLVVGPDHPFARRRSVRLADLDGEPMALLSKEFSTRGLIDGYLAGAGASPQIVCETNSIEVMLGAVSQSRLATIIPEKALRPGGSLPLNAIRLTDPVPVRTSALLWPRHSFRTVAARTFGQLTRERFEDQ